MSSIQFQTKLLEQALATYPKVVPIILSRGKKTSVSLSNSNKELLQFLLDTMKMTVAQQTKINGFLFGAQDLDKAEASSVDEAFNKLSFIIDSTDPVLEVKIVNKWYPVLISIQKYKTFGDGHVLIISPNALIGGITYRKNIFIGDWDFEGSDDKPMKKNLNELLQKYNVRVASADAILKAKELNSRLLEHARYENQVYDAWGTGLIYQEYTGWGDVNVGWKNSPSMVVIEPTLDNEYAHHERSSESAYQLPFIRVFSLKHKAYVFVDVECLEQHVFHRDGKDKIVLPVKMREALESIFNAPNDNIFGDIFHGRHGGIVVLANGPSGVGKTLTAEVFAEFQQRPLYTMEMGEIGTSVDMVEQNLSRIFARAKKWNAVLLFDEADIFLSERVASDLERSAIVGIFLRLLDYYEGTFFLTTNRGEGIDKAFKSRVTLYLDYPELTPETRRTIWLNMLQAANFIVHGNQMDWDRISEAPLNGRQIRNQVRLLKLMHPSGETDAYNVWDSLQFTAK